MTRHFGSSFFFPLLPSSYYLLFLLLMLLELFEAVRDANAYYSLLLQRYERRAAMLRWFAMQAIRISLRSVLRIWGLFFVVMAGFLAYRSASLSGFIPTTLALPFLWLSLRWLLFFLLAYVILLLFQLRGRSQWGLTVLLTLLVILLLLPLIQSGLTSLTLTLDTARNLPFILLELLSLALLSGRLLHNLRYRDLQG